MYVYFRKYVYVYITVHVLYFRKIDTKVRTKINTVSYFRKYLRRYGCTEVPSYDSTTYVERTVLPGVLSEVLSYFRESTFEST